MAGRGRGANPLAHVLQALGEPLELLRYKTWNVVTPEGRFLTEVGAEQFCDVLQQIRGPAAVAEWRRLQEVMRPLATAATALPPVAFRQDVGALRTALLRYAPHLLASGGSVGKLTGPFARVGFTGCCRVIFPCLMAWPAALCSHHPHCPAGWRHPQVLDGAGIRDPFVRNWLDLLSFLLSGLPADGTIAAEVAFMFDQVGAGGGALLTWHQPGTAGLPPLCCLCGPCIRQAAHPVRL